MSRTSSPPTSAHLTPTDDAEQRTLIVVDDDDTFRSQLLRALTRRGFAARGASNADEALALARDESPEMAVVDLRMPGASGLDLVRELKAIDPTTTIVVLTGYGSIATAVEAMRLGAAHYLSKPADVDDILAAFRGESRHNEPEDEHEVPSLARVEWEHIQRVLSDCQGNISHAARLLGVHRRSLQRKLSKYPVRW
jgi:two-component system response regulator RegA